MLRAHLYKHTLNFNFDAGTSRGVLRKKDSYFLKLWHAGTPQTFGLGEAGPLYGLSPDFGEVAENKLQAIADAVNRGDRVAEDLSAYPSVRFAWETALRDLQGGGVRKIFDNDFFLHDQAIPINGLIWMGEKDFMKRQIVEKIAAGFTTIKLKIGAIDFEEELALLKFIRTEFASENLTLRVDANGAFAPDHALEKLKRLSHYDLHSIEQPIAAGQEECLANLCADSPVPIALDEELISNFQRKDALLKAVRPPYIILKPSLMGGLQGTSEWIAAAKTYGIQWWVTSALESNIGLNAICQFTAEMENSLPQGLGTGTLYSNNFNSPLTIDRGSIRYDSAIPWDLHFFK